MKTSRWISTKEIKRKKKKLIQISQVMAAGENQRDRTRQRLG